jgi:hypothetical protein
VGGRDDHGGPVRHPPQARGGGGLFDAEDLGGLGAGELFAVAERQDLAVDRFEGVERFLDAQDAFGADGGLRGGGEPAQELGGQGGAAGRRHGLTVQGDLAAGVAHVGAEVVSPQGAQDRLPVRGGSFETGIGQVFSRQSFAGGGRAETLPLLPGISTTELIRRIQGLLAVPGPELNGNPASTRAFAHGRVVNQPLD